MEMNWQHNPIDVKIDAVGRLMLPKQLRKAAGLTPGSLVGVSFYGAGLPIIPAGRSARIEHDEHGRGRYASKTRPGRSQGRRGLRRADRTYRY